MPQATLADVQRVLTESRFREQVVEKLTTPMFVNFWHQAFAFLPGNALDPVLNKLTMFLLDDTVRNVVTQRRSRLDFDRLLNGNGILLANLSAGLLGEKIAGTFGSFLVTKLINASFRRAALPEAERVPWMLYVDEFQNLMNVSVGFETILTESRKYRLCLTMANQYIGQLSQPVRQSVLSNVGTCCAFRLGADDAAAVSREFGEFTPQEFVSLGRGEAVARVGTANPPFNLKTYPDPPAAEPDPTRRIVARTRRRYCRPRAAVEAELQAEERTRNHGPPPPKPRRRRRGRSKPETPPPEPPQEPDEDDLVN